MTVTNPYATGAHTQAMLNSLGTTAALTLGTTTVPTLVQTELWLDQLAAEVDGLLSARGYGTIPADGATDILMIGRYVAQKAAAMVWQAAFMSDDLPAKVKQWNDEWKDFLERLIAGTQRLVNQSPRQHLNVVYAQRYRS